MAELRIPLSHPILQHSGVIGCALRGQVIDRVKVTATQLVIYSHRGGAAMMIDFEDKMPAPPMKWGEKAFAAFIILMQAAGLLSMLYPVGRWFGLY